MLPVAKGVCGMTKSEQISLLMDEWENKHIKKNYTRFIRDGIVCEERWDKQNSPRVCFFLKEAYTSEEGYDLTTALYNTTPWTMWKKVAIWTQAIHNAFDDTGYEYDEKVLRSKEKEVIDSISIVNVKKSNGEHESKYDDLKKYAEEDKEEIRRQLEIINPEIIVCGNNSSLLKVVLGDELNDKDTWDNMIAMWNDTLVIDYYHPAVHYPNRVNYYAIYSICRAAIEKYNLSYKRE